MIDRTSLSEILVKNAIQEDRSTLQLNHHFLPYSKQEAHGLCGILIKMSFINYMLFIGVRKPLINKAARSEAESLRQKKSMLK